MKASRTRTTTSQISQIQELQTLVETNNHAVAMLEKSDFEPAISTFARALNLARMLMTKNSSSDAKKKRPAAISFDECMERSRASNNEKCLRQEDGSQSYYMYKTAMRVRFCDLPPTRESHVFMAVALVFNAALAYQLAGDQLLQEDLPNTIFVRKAIKLYRLAYNIYHEETIGASPYFCMAIVNNLGLLYQESQCGDKAEKCFRHLLSTLMFLVDCHENMENFEGYFENTAHLFFDYKCNRFAPAA